LITWVRVRVRVRDRVRVRVRAGVTVRVMTKAMTSAINREPLSILPHPDVPSLFPSCSILTI